MRKMNLMLLLYLLISKSVQMLFMEQPVSQTPWDLMFRTAPLVSFLLAVALILLLIAWGAQLLKLFWNRVLVETTKLQEIDYGKALSISIVLALMFS